jgi:hypothetical protein
MTDSKPPEQTPAERPHRRRAKPAEPAARTIEPVPAEPNANGPAAPSGADAPVTLVAEESQGAALDAPPDVPTTGAVGSVAVEHVEFERGAIGGVRATDVNARIAVIGGVAASSASVEIGMVTGIAAREVTVSQGVVRGVVAQQARVEQALVQSVVANRFEAGPTTVIGVALARRIDGEAKILLDWRGGLAFGAALGAFLALIRLVRLVRR